MIGTLTAQVMIKLEELHTLEQIQSEAESVNDTLRLLDEVRRPIAELIASYLLLRERLPHDQIASLDSRITTLAQTVQASHEGFEKERRQVRYLSTIKSQAQQISGELANDWRQSADSRRRPLTQLLEIVEFLPELKDRRIIFDQLRTALDSSANILPRKQQQLDQFDFLCKTLEEHLADVQGLSASIKDFLEKVVKGTATLADLSGDVLAWCQDGTRAAAFRVSFSTPEVE